MLRDAGQSTADPPVDAAAPYRDEVALWLARIAAVAPGVIYSFRLRPDGSTSFPYVSPTMAEVAGIPLSEMGSDGSLALALVHPAHIAEVLASIEASARDMTMWHLEFRYLNPRKGEIWLEGRSLPHREADGSVLWHGFLTDVTERKLVEAALRESETMSALGSLMAGVAHEVRNPLFSISSTVDAFAARFGGREECMPYVTTLRSETERLSRLMRDLLDYGRPPRLETAEASLEQVLQEARRASEPLAARLCVDVRIDVASDVPRLVADFRRLEHAFRNLIENGVYHAPPGSAVRVSARRVGDGWVECRVEDEGPGFRDDELGRVFDPFYTRRRGGTGLGLAIVRRAVEQHGGRVSASNRPDGGALVTVRLRVPKRLSC